MDGNFSQDKFFALAPDNWRLSAEDAPVGPLSATGIHLMDLSIALLGRPVEVWARLATRGSAFANGDTLARHACLRIGRHRPADCNFGNALRRPRGGVRLAGVDGDPRPHASRASDRLGRDGRCTAASPRRRASSRPIPSVRDNLEAFARAVAGQAPYPVSLEEIAINVRTFEAITRSALSGRIESV